ncbi:MAG: hypothetical protein AAGA56_06300 [Myxococcota bacterium]
MITADRRAIDFAVRLDAETRTIAAQTIRGGQVVVGDAAFDAGGNLHIVRHGTGPLIIGDRQLAADATTRSLFLIELSP